MIKIGKFIVNVLITMMTLGMIGFIAAMVGVFSDIWMTFRYS